MLKRRLPILNDDDLEAKDGSKEIVLKTLEIKLSKTRAELELLLAELQLY